MPPVTFSPKKWIAAPSAEEESPTATPRILHDVAPFVHSDSRGRADDNVGEGRNQFKRERRIQQIGHTDTIGDLFEQ